MTLFKSENTKNKINEESEMAKDGNLISIPSHKLSTDVSSN